MTLAEWIVAVGTAYLTAGALFGGWFVVVGVARFDPAAKGTTPVFRLLILPGCVTLWPALAMKWLMRGKTS